jgi:ribosome biogenesis protein BRX1
MLNLQTGLKYRQKIEQKLSLTARQPKGDLCDLDSLEEEVFEDKNTTEIANEVMSNLGTGGEKKKKEKRTDQLQMETREAELCLMKSWVILTIINCL